MSMLVPSQAAGPQRKTGAKECRGAALLVCIFVVALTSLLVVSMLDVETIQMAASRNTVYYEQALSLAGAAAHHALAEL